MHETSCTYWKLGLEQTLQNLPWGAFYLQGRWCFWCGNADIGSHKIQSILLFLFQDQAEWVIRKGIEMCPSWTKIIHVMFVISHLAHHQNWLLTWWIILVRSLINVVCVRSHSVDLELWSDTWGVTQVRSLISAIFVRSPSHDSALWSTTWWFTQVKSHITVRYVRNHSLIPAIWEGT